MDDSEYGTIIVHQLSGPGAPQLQGDPPVFHFDLTSEQLQVFLADPVAFLARLGLGPNEGVAVGGEVALRFSEPRWLWNGERWLDQRDTGNDAGASEGGAPDGGTPDGGTVSTSCFFSSGPDEFTIHTHHGPHFDVVYVDE